MPEGGAFAPACGCRASLASYRAESPRGQGTTAAPDIPGTDTISSGRTAAIDTAEPRLRLSIVFNGSTHHVRLVLRGSTATTGMAWSSPCMSGTGPLFAEFLQGRLAPLLPRRCSMARGKAYFDWTCSIWAPVYATPKCNEQRRPLLLRGRRQLEIDHHLHAFRCTGVLVMFQRWLRVSEGALAAGASARRLRWMALGGALR
jgi:hypothetical protein